MKYTKRKDALVLLADGTIFYGKSVGKKFQKAGEHFVTGVKKIGKGDVLGGLGSIGKAGLTAATALLPIDVIMGRISYDLDLNEAKKQHFRIEIEIQIKVLESKKSFKLSLTFNLGAYQIYCRKYQVEFCRAT